MKRGGFIASAFAMVALGMAAHARGASERYPVMHSDDEWMRRLGPSRFAILRRSGTEPAFSSPLIAERRPGLYQCAGCDQALFDSSVKYDSGDGWPSFWTVRRNVTRTRDDFELADQRTEVHCGRCGGHLGHIFDDGPAPTHLRYCIDGLALTFVPKRSISSIKSSA